MCFSYEQDFSCNISKNLLCLYISLIAKRCKTLCFFDFCTIITLFIIGIYMQKFIANLDIYMLLLLFFSAFVAGFIDSIAGGGGMITIPALLLAGISLLQALATNKLQSSFGSFSAILQFYKKGIY